jgi:GNAT superfamily N-acetyltransferase
MKSNKTTLLIFSIALMTLVNHATSWAMNIQDETDTQLIKQSAASYPENISFSSVITNLSARQTCLPIIKPPITNVLPESFFNDSCCLYEEILVTRINQDEEDEEIGAISFYYLKNLPTNSTLSINYKDRYEYHGYIASLFVDRHLRKKKIGSTLFSKAINTMTSHGCKKIIWKALPFGVNELSQKQLNNFYSKRGGQLLPPSSHKGENGFYFVYTHNEQQNTLTTENS